MNHGSYENLYDVGWIGFFAMESHSEMTKRKNDQAQEWYLERSESKVSRLCQSPCGNERGGTKA